MSSASYGVETMSMSGASINFSPADEPPFGVHGVGEMVSVHVVEDQDAHLSINWV